MKTIKEVNQEIKSLNEEALEAGEKRIKAIKKRLEELHLYKLYLETKPREEFLIQEVERLKKTINSVESHFNDWIMFNAAKYKNPYLAYKNEMGVPALKKQLKTVEYLINHANQRNLITNRPRLGRVGRNPSGSKI